LALIENRALVFDEWLFSGLVVVYGAMYRIGLVVPKGDRHTSVFQVRESKRTLARYSEPEPRAAPATLAGIVLRISI